MTRGGIDLDILITVVDLENNIRAGLVLRVVRFLHLVVKVARIGLGLNN